MSKVLLDVQGGEICFLQSFRQRACGRGVLLSPNNQLMSRKHKLERGCITIKLMKEQLRGSLLGEL